MSGKIDQDILDLEKEMMDKMGFDLSSWMESVKNMPDEEFANVLNGLMVSMVDTIFNKPIFQEAVNSCTHTSLSVPTNHDGDYNVEVLVHTPKSLANETKRACIIYAHGGGAVAGSAHQYKGFLSYMAMSCGVVLFNVEYRLGPGTRAPNNVLDFYEAIKYVVKNAATLGVDSSRVAMAGESGGGYICAGAMVQLAINNESHLVKLAIPIIPMLTDYCFTETSAMTKEEAENAAGQQKIWRLLAGPEIEQRRQDVLLFPGKADDETLSKMPPTIVWESEFDFYITEATRFAHRLRAAGRLLEFVVIPGAKHGSGMNPDHQVFKLETKAWEQAIEEYLLK